MKCRLPGALVLFMTILAGCEKEGAVEEVYVPGPEFQQNLTIAASHGAVRVGDEVILSAIREVKGFVRTAGPTDRHACAFESIPPEKETDVALNLNWVVDSSPSHYSFNVTSAGYRSIVFSEPGLYQLKARSSLWCPPGITSNSITVRVEG